ncbi:MAG: hypothetical protein IJV07_05345 [Alphaproteobacteria bacterium]|nr:hypothetical protein [Alphaproteobacteria bacterium]
MKKLFLCGAAALALTMAMTARAETVTGKVVNTDGSQVTIEKKDGTKHTMKTTPDTTYRKKKMTRHDKKHHGKGHYEPMMEESDWVEIVYTPSNNELVIEEVTVWDD